VRPDDVPDRAEAGFHGDHQAGIATPPLPYLSLAAFDVVVRGRDALVELLRTWTRVAEGLTGAGPVPPSPAGPSAGVPPVPGALTLTFGFGPSLFAGDRFGVAGRRPAPLAPLPPFPGDAIDPAASNGDLCVQACATDPTTAHQAVRDLLNAARPQVSLRWRQTGFRAEDGTADPRGLFGFRDGTANLDADDEEQAARHLWVSDGPQWLHGGSYLVMRRIRLLLDTWDRTSVPQQEAAVGRERDSNRRLHLMPGAHAALAAPQRNGGVRLLRRPYSYDAGVDPNGLLDAGLIFLSFSSDPGHFVTVQRRLAAHDPLNGFSQHLAGAVFACPPGIRPGSFLGAELLS
jgi:deferrochelatase/peroxidase EfeB